MPKKLDPEYVRKEFAKQGYVLTEKYSCAQTPVAFVCPRGHKHQLSWNAFSNGRRCSHCAGQIVKHSDVGRAFADAGYKLVSRYKRSGDNMEFICGQGHRHQMSWNSFRGGARCAYCANNRVDKAEIKRAFEKRGYMLLGEYKANQEKIAFVCPQGHTHKISWAKFNSGRGCAHCAKRGFKSDQPATLYYVKFQPAGLSNPLYKVGITNRTVEERFCIEPTPYKVICESSYLFGFLAQEEEQRILKRHRADRYKGRSLLVSGNTELFTRDVLGLDRKTV